MTRFTACPPRTILCDANAAPAGGEPLGDLPEWDLSDLYAAEDAPELKRDMAWLEMECAAFAADYEGRLAGLDAGQMLECIRRNEKIDEIAGRIMSYAGLRYYQVTTDGDRAKFMSDCEGKLTEFTTPLVFFTLEFNRVDDATYEGWMAADADLARYRPVLDRLRAMKPYQLSDELEKFLHDSSVVGASAWNKLFDETIAGLTFPVGGEELGIEATLNLLTDQDRSKREAGARALADVFGRNVRTFARVHNTLAKEKEIGDRWRGLPTPQASRHLANHVEPEVVEALRDAVVAAYPRLSHRYYALKAKWLGLETLQVWDRNAPLPMEETRLVGWDEARRTVMDAYAGFSPEMAKLAEPFFDSGWIDAGVKPGKAPGAFAHPTVTSVHPYVMLNYLGKPRDVMTLAHELGHGVHQVLAAGQGEMLSSTPADAGRDRVGLRRDADLPRDARRGEGRCDPQDPARGQGRGHDQHRRPPDRLLRLRVQAARRPRRGGTHALETSTRCGCRCRRKASGRCSSTWMATSTSGPISRTSSTRPSTSTPTPSGTVS